MLYTQKMLHGGDSLDFGVWLMLGASLPYVGRLLISKLALFSKLGLTANGVDPLHQPLVVSQVVQRAEGEASDLARLERVPQPGPLDPLAAATKRCSSQQRRFARSQMLC